MWSKPKSSGIPYLYPHVLLHFVKSPCLNSVNPFSTLFSADIQHNCPILFCFCRTYFPPWLAFRFSIPKWLTLHFQGKWPLVPSSFEQMSFSHRFIQVCLPKMNIAKPYQQIFRPFLLTWFGMVASSLHDVHVRIAKKSEKDWSLHELIHRKVNRWEWSCGHFDAKINFIGPIVFKKTFF